MLGKCLYGLVSGLMLMLIGLSSAYSSTVTYTAVDLLDVTPGEDLWQYHYGVSGSFIAAGGFNVLFDPSLYAMIEDPAPTVNADWSIMTTQPDTGLGVDGLYTATALVGSPSLADDFVLKFVWLGVGMSPGAQFFDIYDDLFDVIETARTTPAHGVPLPGTLALMGAGLLAFVRRRRWLSQ